MIILTHFTNVGGNNEGKKRRYKKACWADHLEKKIIFEWREKNIGRYISTDLRMAGWNMGVSGLGSCSMSSPANCPSRLVHDLLPSKGL